MKKTLLFLLLLSTLSWSDLSDIYIEDCIIKDAQFSKIKCVGKIAYVVDKKTGYISVKINSKTSKPHKCKCSTFIQGYGEFK
ncbi:MAG: hypothetical protein Q9M97_05050 [Candidatus Gracilibacteria bacterium]|nr:hypothetical protein [Candidatus Gracilibacteria bacterium]